MYCAVRPVQYSQLLYSAMFCILCFVIGFCALFLFVRHLLEKLQLTNLKFRSVVVTGCDTGFGHDLVLELLRNELSVFAGCLTEKGEENLKCDASELPGILETFPLDVTKDESVVAAYQFVKSKTESLWAIVNNAGIIRIGMTDWFQISDYQSCLDVNTLGVIRVTEAFKPMIKKSHGRIITVASQAARNAAPLLGAYTVSKFASEAYCDTLRLEMIPFGVTVLIIEPAFVKTSMVNQGRVLAKKCWDNTSQEIRDEYGGEEYFHKMMKTRLDSTFGVAASQTTLVIDCLYHAITAVFPRRRYSPDLLSKGSTFLSILPTFWQEKILLALEMGVPKPKCCC